MCPLLSSFARQILHLNLFFDFLKPAVGLTLIFLGKGRADKGIEPLSIGHEPNMLPLHQSAFATF
jgi:hypothetical protein